MSTDTHTIIAVHIYTNTHLRRRHLTCALNLYLHFHWCPELSLRFLLCVYSNLSMIFSFIAWNMVQILFVLFVHDLVAACASDYHFQIFIKQLKNLLFLSEIYQGFAHSWLQSAWQNKSRLIYSLSPWVFTPQCLCGDPRFPYFLFVSLHRVENSAWLLHHNKVKIQKTAYLFHFLKQTSQPPLFYKLNTRIIICHRFVSDCHYGS